MHDPHPSTHSSTLATKLMDVGYERLFLASPPHELDALWEAYGEGSFGALVQDSTAPIAARVLASEGLFAKQKSSALLHAELVALYAEALDQRSLSMANPWGTPKDLGPLSDRILSFGEAALPILLPLLDNPQVLQYGGSRSATSGNIYQYRVKDLAASLICHLRKLNYAFQSDPVDRDAWIREQLGR